jgi:hypothetical protein
LVVIVSMTSSNRGAFDDEVEAALLEQGYVIDDVRDAPIGLAENSSSSRAVRRSAGEHIGIRFRYGSEPEACRDSQQRTVSDVADPRTS